MTNIMRERVGVKYRHRIHALDRYIEVSFSSTLTTEVVLSYLNDVWVGHPELAGFSELVDMRATVDLSFNTGQLASLVQTGRALDDSSQKSKIALVVLDPHTFFKLDIYRTLQGLYPAKNKQVELFDDIATAREWLVNSY